MACSSIQRSSSAVVTKKYDVFVSFRGEDTRNNFTDHLFGALQRKGIFVFRDDKNIKKGESIAPELLCAIEGSRVFVVIFSKNYASSTWCLRELEKILECAQLSKKRVLPIFCDVDPSEVRYQKGSYAEAFSKHEERFKQDSETVQRWRAALTQVASLSGWDLRDKPQYAEIEKIVEEIINILGYNFSSLPNDLVGMHSPIEELEKLLLLDSVDDDVRVVGICGMGGVGKTTLANVLYGKISRQFDACCFIDDVSKIYRHSGPIEAQKQILHQILGGEHLQICNLSGAATLMRSRLRHVRALIILDNVDQAEQLKKLAMDRDRLGARSRIIIVSRDEHVLKVYGVDAVYKVPLLSHDDSLQLFCRKAFKCDNIMSNYDKLAYDILCYAKGLPLAIEVLGSSLFGRNIAEWTSALSRLRKCPNKDIMDVLQLSFDGLEEPEKEIFLDIAFFFNYHYVCYVRNVLNCCGFDADIGLRVLTDKSLIKIFGEINGFIFMSNLLKELGLKIVKESRKWSRLHYHDEFRDVMLENMEKNVEAIVLKGGEVFKDSTLSKMSRLRMLILVGARFSRNLTRLSDELRYIEWKYYPFEYLPSFQPTVLVELLLKGSSLKQLWEGKKYLPNLRALDLSHSKNLIKMPDFREIPNLEHLDLQGCVKLVQLDPSISVLRKLVFLNLKDCYGLRSIPNNICGPNSLKYVNLSGLSKAFKNSIRHLKKPDTRASASHSQSTSSIFFKWITLPSLPSLSCLCELDVSFCGLSQIPDAIGCRHWLKRLNLEGNNFVTLPSLKELSKLEYLNLQHCKHLKSLPDLPSSPACIDEDRDLPSSPAYIDEDPDQDIWIEDPDVVKPIGLYIFNCPKLGDTERCSSMVLSWMLKFIRANQRYSLSYHDFAIVIPGSEIPRWFNNQKMGGSASIDPFLPIMRDNNCIGIICCWQTYQYHRLVDPTTTTDEWIPKIRVDYETDTGSISTEGKIPIIIDRKHITVKSNHMFLMYFPRETLLLAAMSWEDKTLTYPFKVLRAVITYVDSHVEVINSGYGWVFKDDLQRMHCGNSLSRKCKFLAIEDKAEEQPQPESFN